MPNIWAGSDTGVHGALAMLRLEFDPPPVHQIYTALVQRIRIPCYERGDGSSILSGGARRFWGYNLVVK
jgi:hypothetical protein